MFGCGVFLIFTGNKILWYKNIGLTSKLVKKIDQLLVPWYPLVLSVTKYPGNHAQCFPSARSQTAEGQPNRWIPGCFCWCGSAGLRGIKTLTGKAMETRHLKLRNRNPELWKRWPLMDIHFEADTFWAADPLFYMANLYTAHVKNGGSSLLLPSPPSFTFLQPGLPTWASISAASIREASSKLWALNFSWHL